jgi:hypothetical protein
LSPKTKSGGSRFSASLIIGLLLVPLSAVAAVALVSPDTPAEAATVAATETTLNETTTTSTTTVETTIAPEIASAADLAAACGEQGLSLVDKESGGTISPLEQAALDSLRAICDSEGMGLPGKPAPEPVVETVTVAAGSGSSSSDAGSASTTTTTTVNALSAQFESEYAATVAYINAAIKDGAHGAKIDLATKLVAEAATLADSGRYEDGLSKLAEARTAADQATRTSYSDDDDHEGHDGGDDHGEYDD